MLFLHTVLAFIHGKTVQDIKTRKQFELDYVKYLKITDQPISTRNKQKAISNQNMRFLKLVN